MTQLVCFSPWTYLCEDYSSLILVLCRKRKNDMDTIRTFIVLVGISVVGSSPLLNNRSHKIDRIVSTVDRAKVGLDLCPYCINEAIGVIDILLNAILDEGILASCGDLCGVVTNKTGSKALGDICLVVCDGLGLDEFIKALIRLDLDPIWYCEVAKLCPSKKKNDPFLFVITFD